MYQLSGQPNLPASTILMHEVGYYFDCNENYVATWIGSDQRIIVLGNVFRRITGIQLDVTAGRFELSAEMLQDLGFVTRPRRQLSIIPDTVSPRCIELMNLRASVKLGMKESDAKSFVDEALRDAIAVYKPDDADTLEQYFRIVIGRRIMKREHELELLPYDWQAYARFQVSQMLG